MPDQVPEWVKYMIGVLIGGGGLAAIIKAYNALMTNVDSRARKRRSDSILELYKLIDQGKEERKELKREIADLRDDYDKRLREKEQELLDLKDEHTQCLLKYEKLLARVEYLEKINGQNTGS